jgi:hypothetical protein
VPTIMLGTKAYNGVGVVVGTPSGEVGIPGESTKARERSYGKQVQSVDSVHG